MNLSVNDDIKNVDIRFSAEDAFLEYPSSGTFSVKSVGARKPTDLIRIRKIGYGHICLREKILVLIISKLFMKKYI